MKLTIKSDKQALGIGLLVIFVLSFLSLGIHIGFCAIVFSLSNYLLGTTFVVWKYAIFSGVTIFVLKMLFHRNSSKD